MPKFVPRPHKQKDKQRHVALLSKHTASFADSNAVEQVPTSLAEKNTRKEQLQEERRAALPASKVSRQKRKRLEKYIDTKLKKEQNLELIKKLSQQNGQVNTTLLRSSKKLGRKREDKREAISRVYRESKAGLFHAGTSDTLFQKVEARPPDLDICSDSDVEDDGDTGTPRLKEETKAEIPVREKETHRAQPSVSFGAGLKRPLETDELGNPVIKRRKRLKAVPITARGSESPAESEWEGIESEVEGWQSTPQISADGSNIWTKSEDESVTTASESGISSQADDTSLENESTTSVDEVRLAKDEGRKERSSAFKAWATKSRNDALGFFPSAATDFFSARKTFDQSKAAAQQQSMDSTSLSDGQNTKSVTHGRPGDHTLAGVVVSTLPTVFNVPVNRNSELQEVRLALPVIAEEQKIMEIIHGNDITIISGETGSGKTTQIPQFLYEAGYGARDSQTPGLIGITQPRRVAAMSMAKRVAIELGELHNKVAHQIRFDSNVSSKTAIKFMTDGVLLREVAHDFTLSKYSAVIIDEAHERTVNTDLLVGMLSRIVETRADLARKHSKYKPLKLIIMSATMQVDELVNNKTLFRKAAPSKIEIPGRQFEVTLHFARKTKQDYIEEAFRKISLGHKKLPAGGMLVFLTGQNEINSLAKRLKAVISSTDAMTSHYPEMHTSIAEASIEDDDLDLGGFQHDDGGNDSDSESEIRGVDNDEDKEFEIDHDQGDINMPLKIHVVPLYSQLPAEQQMRVFDNPPERSRLIVLATNVAETSITIPNIRYVFDCGRVKEKRFDRSTGVQSFEVGWISKASASQRAGRAGRTRNGHCYRLYSSAVYERDFPDSAEPEILRTSVEGVVLQLKSMGIPKITNFPFPTSPDRQSLLKAERLLEYLGAIRDGSITSIGKELSVYPLSPRFARMLVIGLDRDCIEHALTLVAALAVDNILIPENQLDIKTSDSLEIGNTWTEADNQDVLLHERRRKEYSTFHHKLSRLDFLSDAVTLMTTLCDYIQALENEAQMLLYHKFTRIKALQEAFLLRRQLAQIVVKHRPENISTSASLNGPLLLPTKVHTSTLLRQIIAAGYIDQIAMRADLSPNPPELYHKPKRAIDTPYTTLFPSQMVPTKGAQELDRFVFIHPSSVLAHISPAKLPLFIVYSHLSRANASLADGAKMPKTRMHPLSPVNAAQIVELTAGTPLLEESKAVSKIEVLERDEQGRERRMCFVKPFLVGERGTIGWPLPLQEPRKVVQRREVGKGWVTEKVIS